jgi:hypothetical protein
VFYFHANTLHALADLVGAAGLQHPGQLSAQHMMVRNAQGQARTLASTLETLLPGQLLQGSSPSVQLPSPFSDFWSVSQAHSWGLDPV